MTQLQRLHFANCTIIEKLGVGFGIDGLLF